MQRGNQSVLIYLLVGTTAFCALDYAGYFPETSDAFLPTKNYALEIPTRDRSWSASYGIDIPVLSEANPDVSLSTILQFAEKLISETVDLDQDIVKALGQKFWDLI